jgi:hypothetical protein
VSEVTAGILLEVQQRLESLYGLEHEARVTDFLIREEEASTYPGGGSRTLVSEDDGGVALGVILDDAVGRQLARSDPRVRLDGSNLGPFCTLIEEVSHFVYLLFCAQAARTVTELELELQGEVDKYLCAAFLLSLQNEGAVSSGLRRLLFREYRLVEGLPPLRAERYRVASDLAWRYSGFLEERFLRRSRVLDLAREARRFYRLGQREKLERIATLQ